MCILDIISCYYSPSPPCSAAPGGELMWVKALTAEESPSSLQQLLWEYWRSLSCSSLTWKVNTLQIHLHVLQSHSSEAERGVCCRLLSSQGLCSSKPSSSEGRIMVLKKVQCSSRMNIGFVFISIWSFERFEMETDSLSAAAMSSKTQKWVPSGSLHTKSSVLWTCFLLDAWKKGCG